MIGHAGKTDCAQKDRIVLRKPVDAVARHHRSGAVIGLATPVEMPPINRKAELVGNGINRANTFGHHFFADAIAGNCGNRIALHAWCSSVWFRKGDQICRLSMIWRMRDVISISFGSSSHARSSGKRGDTAEMVTAR